MANPYVILDLLTNRGAVFVGTSHDTPEFAAGNVTQWWRDFGRRTYADDCQLLILADSGGSNGARVRTWKYALQEQAADRFDLEVTVCHYPTGASKWNPIEHRLFSEISKHWAGQPLDSYETILRLIRETKTQSGLAVTSRLVSKHFETGKKISAAQCANSPWSNIASCPSGTTHFIQEKTRINFCANPKPLRIRYFRSGTTGAFSFFLSR